VTSHPEQEREGADAGRERPAGDERDEESAPRDSASGLPPEELEAQEPEELPARESMSVMRGDVSIPLDPSLAADILSDEAHAHPDDAVPDADDAD
jgi:hypothetical protein